MVQWNPVSVNKWMWQKKNILVVSSKSCKKHNLVQSDTCNLQRGLLEKLSSDVSAGLVLQRETNFGLTETCEWIYEVHAWKIASKRHISFIFPWRGRELKRSIFSPMNMDKRNQTKCIQMNTCTHAWGVQEK